MPDKMQPPVATLGEVDDRQRHGGDRCDARQLLSETLRLRRTAQLQRAAAAGDAAAATQLTLSMPAAASGLRRSASDTPPPTTATSPKLRKKLPHDDGGAADQRRRITFHQYQGPSQSVSASSSTSVCLASPCVMTFASASLWQNGNAVDAAVRDCHSASQQSSFVGRSPTADAASPPRASSSSSTSPSLPQFSEFQRSLFPTAGGTPEFVDHLERMQRAHQAAAAASATPVICSNCPASVYQRLSAFHRSTMATEQPATPSSSSSTASSLQSQPLYPPLSITSSVDATSGLLTSVGVGHVPATVTAACRPGNCNKVAVTFLSFLVYAKIPGRLT